MEACVSESRGFANTFNADPKVDSMELKYVEESELDLTWKTTRRQRHKDLEEKIWMTFVQEQEDLLQSVLKEDAYQFIEDLPEAHLNQLLDELKEEIAEEDDDAKEEDVLPQSSAETEQTSVERQELSRQHVTFVEDHLRDSVSESNVSNSKNEESHEELESYSDNDTDLKTIFGSYKVMDTVKEGDSEHRTEQTSASVVAVNVKPASEDHGTNPMLSTELITPNKSSENIRSTVENSTHCQRIKDTRYKLKKELISLIKTIDHESLEDVEFGDLKRMLKKAAEFCNRFQRIYLYQLQRRIYDIRRHSSLSLPFAKHTHYQAQMMRAVSLHQNLLQAFQEFHKWALRRGSAIGGVEAVSWLVTCAREAGNLCARVCTPPHLASALPYNDLNTTFDSLELAIKLFEGRVSPVIAEMNAASANMKNSDRSERYSDKAKQKKKTVTSYQNSARSQQMSKARLAMYDGTHFGTKSNASSATRISVTSRINKAPEKPEEKPPTPSKKKNLRSRRPLMRNPQEGKPRRRRQKGNEVHTMVEGVNNETPREGSRSNSPGLEIQQMYNEAPRRPSRAPAYPTPQVTPRSLKVSARSQNSQIASSWSSNSPRPGLLGSGRKLLINKSPASTNLGASPRSGYEFHHPGIPKGLMETLNQIKRDNSPVIPPSAKEVTRASSPMMSYALAQPPEEESSRISKKKECEVTKLLRELCGGDHKQSKNERVSGAKNAQLLCMNSSQPNTPQLLKILEETIQKKVPNATKKKVSPEGKCRLALNVGEEVTERTFKYRTKFVQHMLASSMYANCSVDKPWQVIGTIADEILDELLEKCAKELEINNIIQELYDAEVY